MLEAIMKKLSGVVLGGVIALLSLVFVLQFGGPQAQGCGGAAEGGANAAAKVYDQLISQADLRAAFVLAGGDSNPELAKQYKMREMVLMGLVEQAVLAREARSIGFHVSEDDVMEQVAEDGVVYVPMSVSAGPFLPPAGPRRYDFSGDDGVFSKDNLKRFIQGGLQRSIRDFAESQIEGTLADRMRKAVMASVTVGSGEVWQAYVRDNENATLKYARFSPVYFGQQIKVSEADLKTWMEANQQPVDEEYTRQKHRYTGLEKQVHARHILIKSDPSSDEEGKEAARARADALLKRVQAGEDFAALAKEHSEDTGSAKKGGDLGFNPKGRMVAPFDEAQFGMQAGQISDIVESTFGFHIIKVEAIREGDVPVDEAKQELAEKLYRDEQAGKLAGQAAVDALATLKAGTGIEDLEAKWKKARGESTDALAPQFRDTRPFGRTDSPIHGAVDSARLADAAFAMDEAKPLPDKPMKLGDDYFVYRLQEKNLAKREDFTAEEQQKLRERLVNTKRREVLTNYVLTLLQQAQKDNAIQLGG